MQDFNFHSPVRVVFGKSSHLGLKNLVSNYGNKVLLVYGGGSIKANGVYRKVLEQLQGLEVQEFAGIEPNPRVETIRKAVVLGKQFQPDLVLAVGGGSVIDAAKLIAASINYQGDPWDFLVKPHTESSKYVALATVLTLAATASEHNSGAVITNWETHEKLFFGRDQLYPRFSILNPEFTFSVNKEQSAYGTIDAFVHVLEQYINTSLQTPMQDRFSEGILLTLIENGPKVLDEPENYDVRANIMLCASFALNGMIAMGAGQDWATHSIEHEFSGFYDIPHAAGLAVILPHYLRVAKSHKLAKLVQYGKRIWNLSGSDTDIAEAAIQKTADFFNSLGAKPNLKAWDIDSEHFDTITSRLMSIGSVGEIKLTEGELRIVLEKSLGV